MVGFSFGDSKLVREEINDPSNVNLNVQDVLVP